MKKSQIMGRISKIYQVWDSGVITSRSKLFPVIKVSVIQDQFYIERVKLEYYSNISGKEEDLLKEELLEPGLDLDAIIAEIVIRMESYEWYENPDHFISDKAFSLAIPNGSSLFLEELWTPEPGAPMLRKSFEVEVDEGEVSYKTDEGSILTSNMRYDIAVSTETLDEMIWYAFGLSPADREKGYLLTEYPAGKGSKVVSGTIKGWSIALSAFDPNAYNEEKGKYEIVVAPCGFVFRLIDTAIKKIWFKAAWMMVVESEPETCEAALRSWIS